MRISFRIWQRILLALAISAFPTLGVTQAVFTLPANPQGVPHYFAGTFNQANVSVRGGYNAQQGRTAKLVEAKLYINGILVKSQSIPLGTTKPILLVCVFDSTHNTFQPTASGIEIQASAKDEFNVTHYASTGLIPVKNKAVILRQPLQGNTPVSLMDYYFGQSNYDSYVRDDTTWTTATLISALNGANVLWTMGHGGVSMHETGVGFTDMMTAHRLNGVITGVIDEYYSEERRARMGNPNVNGDWPPYNTSNNPPINFACLDNCESGAPLGAPHAPNSPFVEILWPYFDMWSCLTGTVRNQALLGQAFFTNDQQDLTRNMAIFAPLDDAYTVLEARDYLLDQADALGLKFAYTLQSEWETYDSVSQLPIFGDFYTRIKGVYTGDTSNRGAAYL